MKKQIVALESYEVQISIELAQQSRNATSFIVADPQHHNSLSTQ